LRRKFRVSLVAYDVNADN